VTVPLPKLRPGFTLGGFLAETLRAVDAADVPPFRSDGADEAWMAQAVSLAMAANGRANPNPTVGCVIVRGGREIASGATESWGGRHAERVAVDSVPDRAAFAEATVYVTLEPCAHHGRQPPCADLLAGLGLARLVIGAADPNPVVAGQGIARLRAAGVAVETGVLGPECTAWHLPFLLPHLRSRTVFAAKWAQTLDGQLALDPSPEGRPGPRWLTGPTARGHTHWLRQRYDAVMVGAGTALLDDPALTVRDSPAPATRPPARIVFDPSGRVLAALPGRIERWRRAFLDESAPTLLLVGPAGVSRFAAEARLLPPTASILPLPAWGAVAALPAVLADPAVERQVGRPLAAILVEGGPRLLSLTGAAGLFDIAHVFVAPSVGGGLRHRLTAPFMADPRLVATAALGADVLAEYLAGDCPAFAPPESAAP
jgi:diaminohydroxyphosphoribosylaminopyrimidine deaminase/5-amino-6-(5-phosphoribosylamino)uracil reductase